MTPDELAEAEGREQARAEMFARAEAQILGEIAGAQAEQIAHGELCRACGTDFPAVRGVPSLCRDCSGAVAIAFVGTECGVCHTPIDNPSDVVTFRRHVGPEVTAQTKCVLIDAMRALVIAQRYGIHALRAIGR